MHGAGDLCVLLWVLHRATGLKSGGPEPG